MHLLFLLAQGGLLLLLVQSKGSKEKGGDHYQRQGREGSGVSVVCWLLILS